MHISEVTPFEWIPGEWKYYYKLKQYFKINVNRYYIDAKSSSKIKVQNKIKISPFITVEKLYYYLCISDK